VVTFKVTDTDGGIEGANVQLGNADGNTDAKGLVRFDKIVPASNAYYVISKNNYETAEGYVDVVDKDVLVEEFLQPLGIPEKVKNTLEVYPNPSKGIFNVVLPQVFNNGQITVIDQYGRTIAKIGPDSKEFIVDISTHSAGIYTLQFIYGNNKMLKRLVKE
jgi:hypothetical protein